MTHKPHVLVVGCDFTRPSDVALVEALRLASLGAASELHVTYVADPEELPDDPEQPAMAQAEALLERGPDHLRLRLIDVANAMGVDLSDVKTYVHVRLGEHAKTLHQVAVDYDADLLVVGNHNRGLVDRLVLGSVSEKLVREAHCPVLVARETDYSDFKKTPLPDAAYPPGRAPEYKEPHDVPQHLSTQRVDWSTADFDGPTGVRIV